MQEQLIEYVTESKTYSKYSQDNEQHIAELCEMYYIKTNTRSNVLSPQRVQINKRYFKNTTEEYNIHQRALPDGCERSEKALKKKDIKSTGSGGGPIDGYLKKMHQYLHDDPQFHPKTTYMEEVDDGEQSVEVDENVPELLRVEEPPPVARSSATEQLSAEELLVVPSSAKKQKTLSAAAKKEAARVKARDEALDTMKDLAAS
ncbi:hypothetical protein EDC94DRAFT_695279 [Helicostylum pulchrum]|nr:hypothetical protein EDC94DRAFT_695279 [Helicostylum pulchrum]